jgi:uncharacterized protein (TIGR02594 family)
MQYNLEQVQTELKRLGFYDGEVDGDPGPLTTRAVKDFQKSRALIIQYPGTIGPKTLGALFDHTNTKEAPEPSVLVKTPWIDLALSKKGLHENINKTELVKFLKSDGRTLGDPTKLPWCGDLVETCIARALPNEPVPTNPYLARNWLKFGIPCDPQFGAVVVFWRGKKNGTSGHVGFLVGMGLASGKKVYYVLGGNQSNRISIAPLVASRALGTRWPRSIKLPLKPHLPQAKGGTISINEA